MSEKEEIIRLLKTSKGQIEGIIKMVENNEYCIAISNQLLASIGILKKANTQVLDRHLHHCVLNASNEDKEKKLDEISDILKKVLK